MSCQGKTKPILHFPTTFFFFFLPYCWHSVTWKYRNAKTPIQNFLFKHYEVSLSSVKPFQKLLCSPSFSCLSVPGHLPALSCCDSLSPVSQALLPHGPPLSPQSLLPILIYYSCTWQIPQQITAICKFSTHFHNLHG